MKPLFAFPLFRAATPPPPYICNNCLLSRSSATPVAQVTRHTRSRTYTTATNNSYTNLPSPPKVGYARLSSRRIVSLSGPDSTNYLQGVITANLKTAPKIAQEAGRGGGFYAAFLSAQGRVLNDVFIYPDTMGIGAGREGKYSGDGGWLIEVDANEAETLARHIKRYKLRAKFDVRVLGDEERSVWSVWNDGNTSSPTSNGGVHMDEVQCADTRAPGMGYRLLLPQDQTPSVDTEASTEEAYRIRRYLLGVPEGQDELIREHALPQESNIDYMGGIDYRKGCYVGQELTIRTHHTGVVRKRILPVMVYAGNESAPERLEYSPQGVASIIPTKTDIGRVGKRGRSAGKWLRGLGNIGLGLCRLETMTGLQVSGEGGTWKEEDEFKLEWEVEGGGAEMVKIKAFVPSWHLKS